MSAMADASDAPIQWTRPAASSSSLLERTPCKDAYNIRN